MKKAILMVAVVILAAVLVSHAAPFNVYGERARARAAIVGQATDSTAISALQAATGTLTVAVNELRGATNGLNAKLSVGATDSAEFMKPDGSTGALHFASGVKTNSP